MINTLLYTWKAVRLKAEMRSSSKFEYYTSLTICLGTWLNFVLFLWHNELGQVISHNILKWMCFGIKISWTNRRSLVWNCHMRSRKMVLPLFEISNASDHVWNFRSSYYICVSTSPSMMGMTSSFWPFNGYNE